MRLIDLTGQVFGRLTVTRRAPSIKKQTMWYCKCVCGNEIVAQAQNLKTKHTRSCGCLEKELTSFRRTINLVGQRFGELIVTERGQNTLRGIARWTCRCNCGAIVLVSGLKLRKNLRTSCGCITKKQKLLAAQKAYIGERFTELTVKAVHKTDTGFKCKCECTCGGTTIAPLSELKSGKRKSCGCLRKRKGPDCPAWKEELTDEHRESRRLRLSKDHLPSLHTLVFKRDAYTCQHCGQRGGTLSAHHIMPWASYPALRYSTENCITLCKKCHIEFHTMYGWEDFDDEDLNEYLDA